MKKLFPIIFLGFMAWAGYLFFTAGGEVSGPTETPGLPEAPALPDPNEGARAAEDGANWLGDTIAGFGPQVWRLVILAVITGCVLWVWKDKGRRSIALGVLAVAALVFAITMK